LVVHLDGQTYPDQLAGIVLWIPSARPCQRTTSNSPSRIWWWLRRVRAKKILRYAAFSGDPAGAGLRT
jgi:hypothetical protein